VTKPEYECLWTSVQARLDRPRQKVVPPWRDGGATVTRSTRRSLSAFHRERRAPCSDPSDDRHLRQLTGPRAPFKIPFATGFVPLADKLDTITEAALIYAFL
jgi:hypothetical protein